MLERDQPLRVAARLARERARPDGKPRTASARSQLHPLTALTSLFVDGWLPREIDGHVRDIDSLPGLDELRA